MNEACAEFGQPGGAYGSNYTYPTKESIDYFVNRGMNTIRFPFMWERIQPTLNGDLDSTELQRMVNLVNYVTLSKKAVIILDLHNYARYQNKVIGTGVPVTSLADVWGRLAQTFKGNSKVMFGLMNEPNGMSTDVWIQAANLGTADVTT